MEGNQSRRLKKQENLTRKLEKKKSNLKTRTRELEKE